MAEAVERTTMGVNMLRMAGIGRKMREAQGDCRKRRNVIPEILYLLAHPRLLGWG